MKNKHIFRFVLILLVLFVSRLRAYYDNFGSFITTGRYAERIPEYLSNFQDSTVTNAFSGEFLFINQLKIADKNTVGHLKLKAQLYNGVLYWKLDNAYVAYQTDYYSVEAGKIRILDGVGYAWNPADLLNPKKSPLYRDSEKRNEDEGTFLFDASLLGDINLFSYNLRMVVVPEKKIENTKVVLSGKANIGPFETQIIGAAQNNQLPLYAGTFRFPVPFLNWITLYSEVRNSDLKNWHFLAGIQFNPSLNYLNERWGINTQWVVEYFYNENGYANMSDFRSHNTNTAILAESLRNYIYVGANVFNLNGSFSAGIMSNIDNEDQSGLLTFLFKYKLTDESSFDLGGYAVLYDKTGKEFPSLIYQKYEIYSDFSLSFGITSREGE